MVTLPHDGLLRVARNDENNVRASDIAFPVSGLSNGLAIVPFHAQNVFFFFRAAKIYRTAKQGCQAKLPDAQREEMRNVGNRQGVRGLDPGKL
jgi:hypothetical protein